MLHDSQLDCRQLSIVIPVFNEQATVRQLVDRVAHALNGIAHEIVLVDDGSTDGTSGEIRGIADCGLWNADREEGWVPACAGMTDLSTSSETPSPGVPEVGDFVGVQASACSSESDAVCEDRLKPGLQRGALRVLSHSVNLGKGAAVRTGFRESRGNVVVIQDADLEYDPKDIPRLIQPILDGKADVVFGSRFSKKGDRSNFRRPFLTGGPQDTKIGPVPFFRIGNAVLTFCSNLMTNLNLSDMECGYKAFRREVIESFEIKENRFGVEPEMTAKVAKRGWRVFEVPVSYAGRDYSEGKKIGWRDAVRALWCIVKYRFGE